MKKLLIALFLFAGVATVGSAQTTAKTTPAKTKTSNGVVKTSNNGVKTKTNPATGEIKKKKAGKKTKKAAHKTVQAKTVAPATGTASVNNNEKSMAARKTRKEPKKTN